MVLTCAGCHHSYDVSSYQTGQRLRCHCGQILVVLEETTPRIHKVGTLHCSNCGGHLNPGQPNCPFCNALVDLTHARMTAYCPTCLAMSKEGAKFCSGCGASLEAVAGPPESADAQCPRCRIQMRVRTLASHAPLECPMCCGLFVEAETMGDLIQKQQRQLENRGSLPGDEPKQATLETETVTYVKCPICEELMNRFNYGRISGVIVDYCRKHGYWLDSGELEKIATWVATGGLEKQKSREMEAKKKDSARGAKTSLESVRLGDQPLGNMGTKGADLAGGFIQIVSRLFDL